MRTNVEITNVDEIIRSFNDASGRLRISVTPACQLECIFCHTEGNPDHGALRYMDPGVFVALLDAFEQIGGREINVTGGEPLLHPKILEMLDTVGERPYQLTFSTNGLALTRLLKAGRHFGIDQFKISLHTIREDEAAYQLLGRAWNYQRLRKNIQAIHGEGYKIILNYVLTKENLEDLPFVLDEAIALGVDLKVIDLETTDHTPDHAEHRGLDYFAINSIAVQSAVDTISSRAEFAELIQGKVGSSLLRYTAGESTILVKNPALGKFETAMCTNCPKKTYCAEGVFALRVNANGTYKPCLIRNDFNVQDFPYTIPAASGGVLPAMKKAIVAMMTGVVK
jgi:cyclic pyranopterin phosphate synthase